MTSPTLSTKSKEVLQEIVNNPGKTIVDIAAALGVAIGQVNGALVALKKGDLVAVEDGKLTATSEATAVLEYGDGASSAPATPGITKVAAKNTLAPEEELAASDTAIDATAGITKMETDTKTSTFIEAEGTGIAIEASAPATVTVGSAMAAIAATGGSVTAPSATPAVATESKAAKARAIFLANKDAPRKVLMALMTGPDVGLTVAGANTYIYNFRKEAGMVVARGTEVKAAEPVVASAPAFVAETPAAVTEAVVVDVSAAAVIETTDTAAESAAPAEAIAE